MLTMAAKRPQIANQDFISTTGNGRHLWRACHVILINKTLVVVTFAVLWAVQVEKRWYYVLRSRRKVVMRFAVVVGAGGRIPEKDEVLRTVWILSSFRCTLYPRIGPRNWRNKKEIRLLIEADHFFLHSTSSQLIQAIPRGHVRWYRALK